MQLWSDLEEKLTREVHSNFLFLSPWRRGRLLIHVNSFIDWEFCTSHSRRCVWWGQGAEELLIKYQCWSFGMPLASQCCTDNVNLWYHKHQKRLNPPFGPFDTKQNRRVPNAAVVLDQLYLPGFFPFCCTGQSRLIFHCFNGRIKVLQSNGLASVTVFSMPAQSCKIPGQELQLEEGQKQRGSCQWINMLCVSL